MTADREPAVRDALREAGVGEDVLTVGLDALGGVGDVRVDGAAVDVTVTVPVPDRATRERLAADVEAAVTALPWAETVTTTWRPAPADGGARVDALPEVKNVVAVASGKGGVGKSTVTANLAVALADAGARVGILDADVYGPNAPSLLGLDGRTPDATLDGAIVPREAHGVRVMSMGFVAGEDDPVIWRGALVDDLLGQLTDDVQWGALDYLFVDMPPGTGDAQLSLVQRLPVAGVVVVTTPQAVAVDDARRGLKAFTRYDVPVLGVVENMSGFVCPDCDERHDVFGSGGAADLRDEFDVPVLGHVPLDPAVGTLRDEGTDEAGGVSIPFVGRVGLPRTREEREGRGRLPPVALRDDGGATKRAVRQAAGRVAARVDLAAVTFGANAESDVAGRTQS